MHVFNLYILLRKSLSNIFEWLNTVLPTVYDYFG